MCTVRVEPYYKKHFDWLFGILDRWVIKRTLKKACKKHGITNVMITADIPFFPKTWYTVIYIDAQGDDVAGFFDEVLPELNHKFHDHIPGVSFEAKR